MYTAAVLINDSKERLLKALEGLIPEGWEVVAHHMTINLDGFTSGPAGDAGFKLCDITDITVKSLAKDSKVMAVGVECPVPSKNSIKHITVAVNRKGGGKPFHSNQLTEWLPIENFVLKGQIEECK